MERENIEISRFETEKSPDSLSLDAFGNPWVSVKDDVLPDGSVVRHIDNEGCLIIPAQINLALE